MNENNKVIQISENHSAYIEKLWFEYNAICNILEYLSNNGGNKEYFVEFFEEAKEKYIELELAKKEILRYYRVSSSIPNEKIHYTFDFENNLIIILGRGEDIE